MNAKRWVLLVNLAVSFYNVGLIWLTQVVCYPLWAYVGRAEFSVYHEVWWHSIWGVVFGPAGLAVLGSVAMIWLRPPGVSARAVWVGVALQATTWVLTAVWWAPLQMRITEGGFSLPVFHLLLKTHWLRVALVTAYGGLMLWMATRALFGKQASEGSASHPAIAARPETPHAVPSHTGSTTPASRFARIVCMAALLMLLCPPGWGESLPCIECETLSKKKLILPDAAHGRVALLVFGFSRESQQATGEWEQRFDKVYGSNSELVCYPIAVLEDVPAPFRALVTAGIRRGVSRSAQDRIALLFHGESGWKQFVRFGKPEDAYLMLIDRKGHICWRGHGPFRESDFAPLQEEVRQLLRKQSTGCHEMSPAAGQVPAVTGAASWCGLPIDRSLRRVSRACGCARSRARRG